MSARELQVSVNDDGTGFATGVRYEGQGHFGLLGMKERAREIGAALEVKSSRLNGTMVRVRLLLAAAAASEKRFDPAIQHQAS